MNVKKDINGRELKIGDVIYVPYNYSLLKTVYMGMTSRSIKTTALREVTTKRWNNTDYLSTKRTSDIIERSNCIVYIYSGTDVLFVERYSGDNPFIRSKMGEF